MKTDFNIQIGDEEVNCIINFSRYRDSDDEDAYITINSIVLEGNEVSSLISAADMESLKDRCERFYNYHQFKWIQERDINN